MKSSKEGLWRESSFLAQRGFPATEGAAAKLGEEALPDRGSSIRHCLTCQNCLLDFKLIVYGDEREQSFGGGEITLTRAEERGAERPAA